MNSLKPTTITIFGATGHLATGKLFPALLALYTQNYFSSGLTIIAFSRRPWSDDDFRSFIRPLLADAATYSSGKIEDFLKCIMYVEGQLDEDHGYRALAKKITEIDAAMKEGTQKLYHLAIQPEYFSAVFENLSQIGLAEATTDPIPKILIEKPFGFDTSSAEKLQHTLSLCFTEDQTYRIDHYLGKEGLEDVMKQNIDSHQIKKITVRILETANVGDRGEFYDETGALRDVGQNHILEMYATLAARLTGALQAGINSARAEAIQNLERAVIVTCAQYKGFTKTKDVAPDSQTETYFKISARSRDERLGGAELIFEAGKSLPEHTADINIEYVNGNARVFDIQKNASGRDAYETIYEKAILGDKAYFVSSEEVLASWKFITPILEHFEDVPLHLYEKNTYPN